MSELFLHDRRHVKALIAGPSETIINIQIVERHRKYVTSVATLRPDRLADLGLIFSRRW